MSDAVPDMKREAGSERPGPVPTPRAADPSPAGEGAPSRLEQVQALLTLVELDSRLRQDEAQLHCLVDLAAEQRSTLEDLRRSIQADREWLLRLPSSRRSSAEAGALRQRLAGNESSLADLLVELGQREAESVRLGAALRRKRQELDAQRTGVRKGLPGEVLASYDQALRSGREPLLAKLVSGICSGCYLRLATSIAQRVRKGRFVAACPHCGRLLYEIAEAEPVGTGRARK